VTAIARRYGLDWMTSSVHIHSIVSKQYKQKCSTFCSSGGVFTTNQINAESPGCARPGMMDIAIRRPMKQRVIRKRVMGETLVIEYNLRKMGLPTIMQVAAAGPKMAQINDQWRGLTRSL
jgi:hypothetical protein